MDLRGTKIGGYIVHALLSDKGGMGTVWEARHQLEPERRAVVKVIRPELLPRPEMVERFKREAIAGMRVSHRRLVQIYDVDQLADGRPYILMEFLDGGDLETHLASYVKLNAEDTLRIAAQIVDGLEALHEKGIVHRDLKPSNVFLLGEDRSVKIVDFGLAKAPTGGGGPRLTYAGYMAGSPYYVAPEQVADFAGTDSRADVYALGMMIIRMLAGRLPYEFPEDGYNGVAQVLLAALDRQRTNPYLARQALEVGASADVPPGWFDILERSIAMHVEARVQRARELIFALADLLPGGDGIVRAETSLYEKASPTDATRRNPSGYPAPAHAVPTTPTRTTHGEGAGEVGRGTSSAAPRRRTLVAVLAGAGVAAAVIAAVIAQLGRDSSAPESPATEAAPSTTAPTATVPPPPALARVRLETTPPGATIIIDGEPLGPSPAIAALPQGSTIAVRAELAGYEPTEKAVTVAEGTFRLELRALVDAGVPIVVESQPEPAKKESPRRRRRVTKPRDSEGTVTTEVPSKADATAKEPPPETKRKRPPDLGQAAGPR